MPLSLENPKMTRISASSGRLTKFMPNLCISYSGPLVASISLLQQPYPERIIFKLLFSIFEINLFVPVYYFLMIPDLNMYTSTAMMLNIIRHIKAIMMLKPIFREK